MTCNPPFCNYYFTFLVVNEYSYLLLLCLVHLSFISAWSLDLHDTTFTLLLFFIGHLSLHSSFIMYALLLFCTYVGRRLWGFPRFAGDCANGQKKSTSGSSSSEHKSDITDSCSQMILQLHDVYDPNKVSGPDVRSVHSECCVCIHMPT